MARNEMTGTARSLRKRLTVAESELWFAVRNRQVNGWKFKRQAPIGPYVVDFLCAEAMLIVELDGIQHLEQRAAHDLERTELLEREGYRVIRFWNMDVTSNLHSVVEAISEAIDQQPVDYRIPRPLHRYDASRSRLAPSPAALAPSPAALAPSPRPSPRRGEGDVPTSEDGESQ